jgi:HPt (histidine-containing phosphotransfer) domain-containing protein
MKEGADGDDASTHGTEEILDRSVMGELEDLESDGDFSVAEIIELFHEQGQMLISEARASHGAGDVETFTRNAHTLKGSARELGAVQLSDLAARWEQMGRSGDMEQAAGLFDEIEASFQTAAEALNTYQQGRS